MLRGQRFWPLLFFSFHILLHQSFQNSSDHIYSDFWMERKFRKLHVAKDFFHKKTELKSKKIQITFSAVFELRLRPTFSPSTPSKDQIFWKKMLLHTNWGGLVLDLQVPPVEWWKKNMYCNEKIEHDSQRVSWLGFQNSVVVPGVPDNTPSWHHTPGR